MYGAGLARLGSRRAPPNARADRLRRVRRGVHPRDIRRRAPGTVGRCALDSAANPYDVSPATSRPHGRPGARIVRPRLGLFLGTMSASRPLQATVVGVGRSASRAGARHSSRALAGPLSRPVGVRHCRRPLGIRRAGDFAGRLLGAPACLRTRRTGTQPRQWMRSPTPWRSTSARLRATARPRPPRMSLWLFFRAAVVSTVS